MSELPVFPLSMVVFPGMTVPLNVFEARYKRLVRGVEEMEHPRFIIALPARSKSNEASRTPSTTGMVIDVLHTEHNGDGTIMLFGHATQRSKLTYTRSVDVPEPGGEPRPLWFATAEPWPLERSDPNEERIAAWDALEAFEAYGKAFFAPSAREQAKSSVPEDLLYQASFVCANLHLPVENAQHLLEANSLVDRFARAREAIQQRLAAVEAQDALGQRGDA